jgi:hypothetical protein
MNKMLIYIQPILLIDVATATTTTTKSSNTNIPNWEVSGDFLISLINPNFVLIYY